MRSSSHSDLFLFLLFPRRRVQKKEDLYSAGWFSCLFDRLFGRSCVLLSVCVFVFTTLTVSVCLWLCVSLCHVFLTRFCHLFHHSKNQRRQYICHCDRHYHYQNDNVVQFSVNDFVCETVDVDVVVNGKGHVNIRVLLHVRVKVNFMLGVCSGLC